METSTPIEGITLKHLAPYLPYGLNMQYIVRDKVEKTGILQCISHNEYETHPTRLSMSGLYELEHIWMFRPLLRHLSDLTKEIDHNGGGFVPIEKLKCICKVEFDKYETGIAQIYLGGYDGANILENIQVYNLLLEWHFDVFGLIERGLAININDMQK